MLKRLSIAAVLASALFALAPAFSGSQGAWAQSGQAPSLYQILEQLQRNPAYMGQVLGAGVIQPYAIAAGFVYEVRILTPDDRIVVVLVDPWTGAVID